LNYQGRTALIVKNDIFYKKAVAWAFWIVYCVAVEIALSHGVADFGVSSYHGMADSSLRQGQVRLVFDRPP
jgi:hypothetical protein